ncbi:hypothetical protein [Paraliomyxa miuraensis]|nr:hypothetical protein [Paraliomyxa miuraensis]MCX4244257.1 hypothetical protein [Paraliomyxa miuraensis]
MSMTEDGGDAPHCPDNGGQRHVRSFGGPCNRGERCNIFCVGYFCV